MNKLETFNISIKALLSINFLIASIAGILSISPLIEMFTINEIVDVSLFLVKRVLQNYF